MELKAKEKIVEAFEAQLLNYLRSTEIELGLLLNFGKQPEFKRKYFSNKNKHNISGGDTRSSLEFLLSDDPS